MRPRQGHQKEAPNRINEKIKGVKEVRLVGDNVEPGIYAFDRAMQIAEDLELDLVEIAATAVKSIDSILKILLKDSAGEFLALTS